MQTETYSAQTTSDLEALNVQPPMLMADDDGYSLPERISTLTINLPCTLLDT